MGGKRIAWLFAILAAFAVFATLGNNFGPEGAKAVGVTTLTSVPPAGDVDTGDTITFTGTTTSAAAAGNVVLTLALGPNQTVFGGVTCTVSLGGPLFTSSVSAGGLAQCTFPNPGGIARTYTLTQTSLVGDLPNGSPDVSSTTTFLAEDDGPDGNAAIIHNIETPDLSVVKECSIDGGAFALNCGNAQAGISTGSYQITISNALFAGNAAGVTFTDQLDGRLSITSITDSQGGSCIILDPQNYSCSPSIDIPPGGTFVVTVNFLVGANDEVDPVVINNIDDATAENITDTFGTVLPASFALVSQFSAVLTKIASPSSVSSNPVQEFVWIYTVTNTGTGVLSNWVLADPTLDGGSGDLVVGSGNAFGAGSGCVIVALSLTCTPPASDIQPLVPGASFSVTVKMQTVLNAAEQNILNTAQFDADEIPAIQSSTGHVNIDNNPILSITKTATSDTVGYVNGGPATTFNIAVVNNGNVDALNVVVADLLPVGLTAVTNTCNVTVTILANTTFNCAVTTVNLTNGTTPADGNSFVNTATATYNGVEISASALVSAAIPHVTVAKTAQFGNTNSVGGPLAETFTVTVTNDGSAPTGAGVLLRDAHVAPFDVGELVLVAGSFNAINLPGCTAALFFGAVGCPVVLGAGGIGVVTFSAQSVTNKPDHSLITNTASVFRSAANAAGANTFLTLDKATTQVLAPMLEVTKAPSTSPISVDPAEQFAFIITVKNIGHATATDIVITDFLANAVGLMGVPTSFDVQMLSGVLHCDVTAGLVLCDDGGAGTPDLLPGDSVTIVVPVIADPANLPVDGESIVNSAEADCANCPNSAVGSTNVVVGNNPSQTLTKTAPGTVDAGGTISYLLTVTNNSGSAFAYTVIDTLPGGVTNPTTNPLDCIVTVAGQIVTWNITVPANSSESCTITVTVPAGTPIGTVLSNSAILVSNGTEVAVSTVVTTVANEQLTITKTPSRNPVSSNPADPFAFNIVLTNNGNAIASGITFVDTLPATLTGLLGPNPVVFSNGFICTQVGQTITCAGGTLAPGASVNLSIPVIASGPLADGTVIVNTVTVTTCTISGVACANNPSATTTVTILNHPVLSLVKQVESGDPVIAGGNIMYAVTVANTGGSPATVVINDTMPAGLTNIQVVGATAPLTCTANTTTNIINCTGVLAANSSVTLHFQGTVPANTANGSVYANSVTLTSPLIPQVTLTAGTVTNVVAASLTATKVNAPLIVGPSGVVTSTILVHNLGNSTAANVGIFDDLPAGATFVPVGSTPTCVVAGGSLSSLTAAVNNATTFTANPANLAVGAIININGVVGTRTITAINGNSITVSVAFTAANGAAITYAGSATAEVFCSGGNLGQGSSTTFTVKWNVGPTTGTPILCNTVTTNNQNVPNFPNATATACVTVFGIVAGAGLVHVDVDAASESAAHASTTTCIPPNNIPATNTTACPNPANQPPPLDPNQVLHNGNNELNAARFHDNDDATGSLHTVCLISASLGANDQGDIVWSIVPTPGSQATVSPAGGTKVILDISDLTYDDPAANCVQWRSAGEGGQTITASHAISGQVFYAAVLLGQPVGNTPLVKEWNSLDYTTIVSVTGNVGSPTLFTNTQDLASWTSLALGGTCIRDTFVDGKVTQWVSGTPGGDCVTKPNVDTTTFTQGGSTIVSGGNAGLVVAAGARSFIDYTIGAHFGIVDALNPEYNGPIDGAEQTYTFVGCGSARVENPVTGVTTIIDGNPSSTYPSSVTVLSSDKGVGFQITGSNDGNPATTIGNASCAPNQTSKVTIHTEEETQLRSDLDTTLDENVTIIWTVAPPPSKQVILAFAGQRVILEHDWRIGPSTGNDTVDSADAGLVVDPTVSTQCPIDDGEGGFNVHYVRGGGPGNFLPTAAVSIIGNDDARVYVLNGSNQQTDYNNPAHANTACISRVLYESEDPGEIDIEAFVDEGGVNLSKIAFVIYYMKFEDVVLSVVDDVAKPTHNGPDNAGNFETSAPGTNGDYSPGNPWNKANDVATFSANVSKDVLVRGRVRGWFWNSNPSGRAADASNPLNVLPANRWVMPDDWALLAGGPGDIASDADQTGTAEQFRPEYDIMVAPNNVKGLTCDTPAGGCAESTSLAADGVTVVINYGDVAFPVEGPYSLIDVRGAGIGGAAVWSGFTLVRNTILRDGDVDWWDAPMPPAMVSVDARGAGFIKQVRKQDVYWTGTVNSGSFLTQDYPNQFYWVNIPDSYFIPPVVAGGGFLWNTWGIGGAAQGPYNFWWALPQFLGDGKGHPNTNPSGVKDWTVTAAELVELQDIRNVYKAASTNPAEGASIGRTLVVYSDNHGEFMVTANGDFKLTYDECDSNVLGGGGKQCAQGDKVGTTTIYATADYPDFRGKHFPVRSEAPDTTITWTWGGYKVVTIEDGETDFIKYVVFHALDRDAFCAIPAGRVSLHPVLSAADATNKVGANDPIESVDFLIDAGEGIITSTSTTQTPTFGVPGPWTGLTPSVNDGKQFALQIPTYSYTTVKAAGGKVFTPLFNGTEECQAWIKVSNTLFGRLNILGIAHDDEGDIGFDRIVDFQNSASYDLTFRWSLITWAGKDGITPTDALKGTVGGDTDNDIFDQVTAVYGWNQASQTWLGFFPAGVGVPGANDLTSLKTGSAYWIAIKGPGNVTWTIATNVD